MANNNIPEAFFNMLPLPILVAKYSANTLNMPHVFINRSFIDVIGWQLTDIPDKHSWWHVAYPDQDYARVIERQWELSMAAAKEIGEKHVFMEVNLTTKYHGEKRFKVYIEIDSLLLPGYNVLTFQPL